MKQVLVVDDERPILTLMREWLVSGGHAVVALSDFHAAKNYLVHNEPDVIVTDVRIGANNGLQLVSFAKHDRPDTIAICVTGFDDVVLRAEAERIGARYCIKPLSREQLLEMVSQPILRAAR